MSTFVTSSDRSFGSLRNKANWIIAFGLVVTVLGLLATIYVIQSTTLSVIFVGTLMMMAGAAEVIVAMQASSWSRKGLWVFLGILSLVSGIVLMVNPELGAISLTMLLGCFFVIMGGLRCFLAMEMRNHSNWGWLLISGLLTLLLGIVILAAWPTSSAYTLGILLGVNLLFCGSSWAAMGFALRANLPS